MKKCQKTSKKVKKMKKAVQLQGRHVAFRGRPGKLSGPALVFSDSRLSELVVQSPMGLKVGTSGRFVGSNLVHFSRECNRKPLISQLADWCAVNCAKVPTFATQKSGVLAQKSGLLCRDFAALRAALVALRATYVPYVQMSICP